MILSLPYGFVFFVLFHCFIRFLGNRDLEIHDVIMYVFITNLLGSYKEKKKQKENKRKKKKGKIKIKITLSGG